MNIPNRHSDNQLTLMMHQRGIRPSAQRIAVLSYVANTRRHPTADEIYTGISPLYPSLSRTTVYNSLHVLVDAGLLRELDIDSGNCRYDFALQPDHSHFTCRKCGRIMDMELPEHIDRISAPGYEIDSIDVILRGICPDCNKNTQQQ